MSSARYVVVACTQKDRWFDLDAERTAHVNDRPQATNGKKNAAPSELHGRGTYGWTERTVNEAGAPPLDCWLIDNDPPPTTEEPPMSESRFLIGDVFDRMAELPDNSVDLIVTSPPFLALRSYLPADHPDKAKEIGSEPTPAAFLSTLLALTREWRRILTPTGSLCVELGDTYAGSGGAGGDYGDGGLREGQPRADGSASRSGWHRSGQADEERKGQRYRQDGYVADSSSPNSGTGWPLAKSLCLIPSLFAGSLAYGRNLLQPDDQLEPWRVRNLIVWHRPNPPVGALGDKVRPSTSYVTVACTAKDRWFDLDSERSLNDRMDELGGGQKRERARMEVGLSSGSNIGRGIAQNPAGAPPLDCWIHDDAPNADVWTIPTAPYAGAHYATFPPALPRKLINLMCPRQVCTSCGEPRRRIVDLEPGAGGYHQGNNGGTTTSGTPRLTRDATTLGWSYCACLPPCPVHNFQTGCIPSSCPNRHAKWRRGIVLDPFAGSGTTLQAASELGRDSIGIDLDRRNLDLARQRLGMFLVEEDEVPA